MGTSTFKDLLAWQKAHIFVLAVYKLTGLFPKEETYGLTSQLRRAAVSIAANIAEGYKKHSDKEKVRFYNIAQGSVEECRYYLILIADLNYGNDPEINNLLEEVSKLITSYIKKIQQDRY